MSDKSIGYGTCNCIHPLLGPDPEGPCAAAAGEHLDWIPGDLRDDVDLIRRILDRESAPARAAFDRVYVALENRADLIDVALVERTAELNAARAPSGRTEGTSDE